MALPAGLATFTLTGGAFTDATGAVALAGVVGSLIPVDGAGRPSPVLHPSTGKLIVPAAVPITVAGDGTWSVGPLPYTNDPAFAAPFRYSVSWNVSSLGATPGDRIIEVPVGSGSVIDYDLMGSSIGSPVTPVAVPLVTSVAGVTGAVTGAQIAADAALRAAFDAGSKPWLQAVAGAFGFAFTSLTTVDAATGLPTAAAVKWPDGTTGTFTGTTDSANGYTGYAVTWAGTTTKTVTASGITYDTSTGLALGPTTLAVA